MKRGLIIFFQIIIVFVGVSAFAFMLWEPHLEGRNVNATLYEIYFKDPFLAYAYIGSIPFFVGLNQVFTLLRYIRENKIYSQNVVKILRNIKYCALAVTGFVFVGVAYIFITVRGKDDIAGGVAIGLFIIFISMVIATVTAVFERLLRSALNLKSEKLVK